jgi:hypothetical protein
MSTELKTGDLVWVTLSGGVTLPTPTTYGPYAVEFWKQKDPGATFSAEQPQLNWATFAVYLMTDYGVPQSAAIQVTRVLTAVGTPCNAETIKQVTEALKDRKGL